MPRYYAPEESLINGIANGISGVLEGFVLTFILNALEEISGIFSSGTDVIRMAFLILSVQTLYLLFRIFIAFIFMRRFSTIIYYLTFTATYVWFNMYLGDYLSALMVLLAVFISLFVRAKMEEYERPVL